MTKKDLLIIDEADDILIDKRSALPTQRLGVIALSATNWNNEYSYEKEYLVATLGFKVHDSLLKETFKPLANLPPISIEDFFKRNPERAKMIYC